MLNYYLRENYNKSINYNKKINFYYWIFILYIPFLIIGNFIITIFIFYYFYKAMKSSLYTVEVIVVYTFFRYIHESFNNGPGLSNIIFTINEPLLIILFLLSLNRQLYHNIKISILDIFIYSFIFITIITSIINSNYLSISITKILYFFLLYYILNINIQITIKNNINFNKKIFQWGIFLTLYSFPMLLQSQGYYLNGGFNGILNHPQAFSIISAVFCIFIFIYINQEIKVNVFLYYMIGLILILMCILSLGRTGVFSLFLGLFIFYLFKIKDFLLNYKSYLLLLSGIVIIILNYDIINFEIKKFIYKASRGDNAYEQDIGQSRSNLIQDSIKNFLAAPYTGIGFAIQYRSDKKYDSSLIKYMPFFNFPISMPYEKGNQYFAILEETGIIGFVTFFSMLFYIFLILRKYPLYYTTYIVILMTFNGESTLFGLKGLGPFFWFFIIYMYYQAVFYNEERRFKKLI